MWTRLRQERGVASALLLVYAFLLFATLFTGYTAYHRLVAIRQATHAALDQAALVAAQQIDPNAAYAGQVVIVPSAAQAAFDSTLPGLLAAVPSGAYAGPLSVTAFTVYQQDQAGAQPLPGWKVMGPSVFAEVSVPVRAVVLGAPAFTFTMRVATLQNTPLWNSQSGSWGG